MGLLLFFTPANADTRALRRAYNDASAAIDSLVSLMRVSDADVLDKLPEARPDRVLPEGMTAVMIFWADDEARVWLNDFPVGETRLTPLAVSIPDLYFHEQNRLRVRCWDTDWVESCFLGGLYLKDAAGALYPIAVSNAAWEADGGQASEIVYAHPLPDIPAAEPIWGDHPFGIVNLSTAFDIGAIDRALARSVGTTTARQREMDYHNYAQQIATLQARRATIAATLARQRDLDVPLYNRDRGRSAALTLGKTAPLTEDISAPEAQKLRTWSENLPAEQRHLIYPTPRALKGERAANLSDGKPVLDTPGTRQQAYRPPEDRGGSGNRDSKRDDRGAKVQPREGRAGASGRATRLGLLLPTLALGLSLYVITRRQLFTGGRG